MRNREEVIYDLLEITDSEVPKCYLETIVDYFDHINKKKLKEREVKQIRHCYETQLMSQGDLASAFGVNPATISRIVRGIYHKEV